MSWGRLHWIAVFGICLEFASCDGSTHASHGSKSSAEADASQQTTPAPEAGTCFIETTNYDQSCSVDSNCVGEVTVDSGPFFNTGLTVTFGRYCRYHNVLLCEWRD